MGGGGQFLFKAAHGSDHPNLVKKSNWLCEGIVLIPCVHIVGKLNLSLMD